MFGAEVLRLRSTTDERDQDADAEAAATKTGSVIKRVGH